MDNQKNPNSTPSASPASPAPSSPFMKSVNPTGPVVPPKTPVMSSFDSPKHEPSTGKVLFVLVLMAALGIGTGYGLATFTAQTGTSLVPKALNPNAPAKGKTFGASDTTNYKDIAEGTLKDGGIEGEGQFHLERPGGESQNVYLTSSTVDLSQFKGQKIKVWGQTQAAQKAGWLMDVGKVEVQ